MTKQIQRMLQLVKTFQYLLQGIRFLSLIKNEDYPMAITIFLVVREIVEER